MAYKNPPKVTRNNVPESEIKSRSGISGGLIGVGANIVSGLVNNAFARSNAREQRAWQEQMWHKQNAYNDPSAMKERMLAAGLNPFQMTGAEPAGSAGTGATAETMPIADPLSAIRAVAEIKGINAQTSKTETESDKIIQETINLQIAERLGLVSAEEAQLRMKDLRELYGTDRSPVELSAQETESRISDNRASAIVHLSDADLNSELAEDSRVLRESRKDLLNAQNDDYRSQIQRRIEQTAIDYALLKVQQAVGKSQFFLNQSMTDNQKRDFNEKVRTFDARKTALDIGNQLGLTDLALKEYADAVNDAWKTVMLGNPFTNPSEYFNAISLVYGDTLRNISGGISAVVTPPSKKN